MTFREVIGALNEILTGKIKLKLIFGIAIQIFASLLDFVAIILFGLLGLMILSPYALNSDSTIMARLFQSTPLPEYSMRAQAVMAGTLVILLFSLRSSVYLLVTKRINKFLVEFSSNLGAKIMREIFSRNLDFVRKYSFQEMSTYLLSGVNALFVRFLGSAFSLVSDLILICVVVLGLCAVNPLTALLALTLFGGMGVLVYQLSHGKVTKGSETDLKESIRANARVLEMFRGYKELKILGSYEKYIEEVRRAKQKATSAVVNLNLLPIVNKALFETFTLICLFVFGAIVFAVFSQEEAVGQLSVFLAASSRLAPSFLRLQQSFLTLKASSIGASGAIQLYRSIRSDKIGLINEDNKNRLQNTGTLDNRMIELREVNLTSDGESILSGVNLCVQKGEKIAIVGESGSGKSTLLDLMMGLRSPTAGKVFLANSDPIETVNRKLLKIGFVPQNVTVFSSSLRDNIVLGRQSISDEQVQSALIDANLEQFMIESNWNLDMPLGEKGRALSGGEAQRLGIARALVGHPELLFLDEITSSLDAENERLVIESIAALPKNVTVVAITHSISKWTIFERIIRVEGRSVEE
jgi:ATP-binding cassette subfamily C protein